MKKASFLTFLTLCFLIFVHPQTTIENLDDPQNKKAGRIVRLEEVFRIKDNGRDIIFRFPTDLKIGPKGGIYFYDNGILHKFDSRGNFLFTVLKIGEGPAEVMTRTQCAFLKNNIIVQAGTPPKILIYDLDGKLIDEMRTETPHAYRHFIGIDDRLMGFLEEADRSVLGSEGYFDFPLNLYEVFIDSNQQELIASFPVKHYVKLGGWWAQASPVFAFKSPDTLLIVHTEDYKISVYDIKRNVEEKIIRRDYKRVKYVPSKEYLERIAKAPPKANIAPIPKFEQDIRYMALIKEDLWVLTSTRDEKGRHLIDVFDAEGIYVDNFYLEFPNTVRPHRFSMRNVVITGKFIFSIDTDTDDFCSIAKYKIIDNK